MQSILDKIKTKSPLVVNQVIACVNSYYNKDENGFARKQMSFRSALLQMILRKACRHSWRKEHPFLKVNNYQFKQ
jgi:hypothetical protein